MQLRIKYTKNKADGLLFRVEKSKKLNDTNGILVETVPNQDDLT